MRLATISDKARIEEICNDPVIRVWTAFEGAPLCNATPYLTAPSFAVLGENGCFLAHNVEPARYIIHTNLLPNCRGERAVEASKQALAIAFLQTDATELLTGIPTVIPHARLLARRMGFQLLFNRQSIWPALGELHAMGFYAMTIDEWIRSGVCESVGREFHERLHSVFHQPPHREEAIHNAYVGAAVAMVRNGQAEKAVQVFNRWARFAMYEPISILSLEPLRIDIKTCVIRVEGDQYFMEEPHA